MSESINCLNIVDLKRQAKFLGLSYSNKTPRRLLCNLVNTELLRRKQITSNTITTKNLTRLNDNVLSDAIIDESVEKIVNSSFKIDKSPPIDVFLSETIGDKMPEDPRRTEKTIATDFVVNDFFASKQTLYAFLHLVYGSFQNAIALYVKKRNIVEQDKIVFVYKGGNVMRMVSNEFILELPANATSKIDAFYRPFFKRSDADFSIYVHPDIADYDQIYQDMTVLAYVIQFEIRKVFLANPIDFFDFFKYNREFREAIEQKYITFLNKSIENGKKIVKFNLPQAEDTLFNSISNEMPDSARFFMKNDFGSQSREIGRKFLTSEKTFLPITFNDALDFSTGNLRRAKFTLVRTKVLFNVKEIDADGNTKFFNIGGELIDVSVPHRLDSNVVHFFEYFTENVSKFSLTFGEKQFQFNSLSLKYLVDDLQTILFEFNTFPWQDLKYEKRIHRLFYLFFVQIFIAIRESSNRLRFLRLIRNEVLEPLLKDLNFDFTSYLNSKIGSTRLYMNDFIRILPKIVRKINTDAEKDSMKKMLLIFIDDADMMIHTIDQVQKYCKTGGVVQASDIYKVDIDALF